MAGMTCSNCAGAVAFGQAFCPTCGGALAAPPPPPPMHPPAVGITQAATAAPPVILAPPPVPATAVPSPDPASVDRASRRLTATTLGMYVPVLMVWLASVLFVSIAGGAAGSAIGDPALGAGVVVGLWTLGAGLMFVRPVETGLARYMFKVRKPTPIERGRLEPIWHQVCARAGIQPDEYLLRVQDKDDLNAFAAAAHIVSVTRTALELPDDELAAIIAHELGHHLEMHPTAGSLTFWYGLPVLFAERVVVLNVRVSAFFARFGLGWALMVYALLICRWFLLLPVRFAHMALAILGRPAEYAADRRAAELGYGRELMMVFQRFIGMGFDEQHAAQRLTTRMFSDHPPLHKRMQALDKRRAT